MGKNYTKVLSGILAIGLIVSIFSSCTTKDLEEVVRIAKNTPAPDPDPQGNPGPYAQYTDARAVLVATKTKTSAAGTVFTYGTAVAVFYQNPGDNDFIEAGTVKVEGEMLDLMPNKSYAYTDVVKSSALFTGIEFTNPIMWEVSGNGPVTGFNHGLTGNFPNADTISSSGNVNKNSSYTLKVGSVTHADSVLFNIGGENGTRVTKTLAGNAKTCTFTAAELSVLEGHYGIVQVAPYRVTSAVYSGRKNYFIRETVSSKNVYID
jgi:hypothetical protein